jgi:hypothetical protein
VKWTAVAIAAAGVLWLTWSAGPPPLEAVRPEIAGENHVDCVDVKPSVPRRTTFFDWSNTPLLKLPSAYRYRFTGESLSQLSDEPLIVVV